MDETAGTPMETDVSSTTQDIPPVQEESGPTSSVEVTFEIAQTTVVIEEYQEEDQDQSIDSNTAEEELLSLPNPIVQSPSKMTVTPTEGSLKDFPFKKSHNKETIILKTPEKDSVQALVITTSPQTKDGSPQNSPSKCASPQKNPVKDINLQTKSINDISFQKSPANTQLLLKSEKDLNAQKTLDASPPKIPVNDKSLQKTINIKSLLKLPVENSVSEKSIAIKSLLKLPVENSELEKSIENVPNEKPTESSPSKPVQAPIIQEEDAPKTPEKSTFIPDKSKETPESTQKNVELVNSSKSKPSQLSDSAHLSVNNPELTSVINADSQPSLPLNSKENTSEETAKVETQSEMDIESSNIGDGPNSEKKHDSSIVMSQEKSCEMETNDTSQTDTESLMLETLDKDRNKSISRELKSLIMSAKESKIINECTQLTSKTRKSRTPMEDASSNLGTSMEVKKIMNRRSSNISQKSNTSEKSEKAHAKRSMRSQNPEFVCKNKQFLNSVTGKSQKDDVDSSQPIAVKAKENQAGFTGSQSERNINDDKKTGVKLKKLKNDNFCWRCHWPLHYTGNEKASAPGACSTCPRSYHFKCLNGSERAKLCREKTYVCPECLNILQAESSDTRSPTMRKISLGFLCQLLKYAVQRIKNMSGMAPFLSAVDRNEFPDYDKYIVHPMDLSIMEENIDARVYGSTEALIADSLWILHNSIIFNTPQSKLTGFARNLVRACRAEMGEIEACHECYEASVTGGPTWFSDVCSAPHILLWAKLKGFPFWPAKGMALNTAGMVDVRFFGAHDRAWVPARDCFLYSEQDPNTVKTKRADIVKSITEAATHVQNIRKKFGKFVHPPFKVLLDPSRMHEQLKAMIPGYPQDPPRQPLVKAATRSTHSNFKKRSASKSSKDAPPDGAIDEAKEAPSVPKVKKMSDEANESKEVTESPNTRCTKLGLVVPSLRIVRRKRQHLELEEANELTIMDGKRKRLASTEMVIMDGKNEKILDTSVKDTSNKTNDTAKIAVPKKAEKPERISARKDVNSMIKVIPSPKVTSTPKSANKPVSKDHTPKETQNTPTTSKEPERVNLRKAKQKATRSDTSSSGEKDKPVKEGKPADKIQNNGKDKSLPSTPTTEKNIVPIKPIVNTSASVETTTNSKQSTNTKDNTPDGNKRVANKSRSIKDKIIFDDEDASLAAIARKTSNKGLTAGLPTITNVRSLSSPQSSSLLKTPEATKVDSNSSVFTHTSTNNVNNMKDAVAKLQKLRSDCEQPMVGRVGVRSFARMTSPPRETESSLNLTDAIEVEVKAEPMDFEDEARQSEKLEMMQSFCLRPVNPQQSLRQIRINKVTSAPSGATSIQPPIVKPPEVRPRAKKTFPQPKKPDDGRSELNCKNSMVYIPIQPPMTQAPVRAPRPSAQLPRTPVQPPRPPAQPPRPLAHPPCSSVAVSASNTNSHVNTVTTPLKPPMPAPPASAVASCSAPSPAGAVSCSVPSPAMTVPTAVHTVPTAVHTVPYITSVNGQWTLSLQPMMSVGAIESTSSPSGVLNGLPERPPLAPLSSSALTAPAPAASQPASQPAPPPPVVNSPATTLPNRTPADVSAPGEPPRLQQKPPLLNPLDSSVTTQVPVPTPSLAGPASAKLNQNATKLADFFRNLLEDSLEKLDDPAAEVTALKLQLEQLKWRHKHELLEAMHNHDLTMAELRMSFEKEKARAVSDIRRACFAEQEAAVKSTKMKQWCANCSQEAQYYCCWNTSYCDLPCQRAHWAQHFGSCTQQRPADDSADSNSGEDRLQPPETLTKATAITVGGKIVPARVLSQMQSQTQQQKASLIVSMVEDSGGNQTVKCVGSYRPSKSQPPALHVTKQLQVQNNDDNTPKKVVTSGGYLIVGGNSGSLGNSSLVIK